MKFKIKDMDIESGGPLIAILNRKDAMLMDLHNEDRISISRCSFRKSTSSCSLKNTIITALDISESSKTIKPGSIGLFEEGLRLLRLKHGSKVNVNFSPKPVSTSYIRQKLDGNELNENEIRTIVQDIVDNRLTEIELASFVTAGYIRGLTDKEIISMTKAIIDTGGSINIGKHPVVDMHCIGGVAGNRTTMIVVPVLACLGYYVPKTSSRAITSPSGTADTFELFCNVSLSLDRIRKIVRKIGACIVWGGAVNLAPADDKIISVEYPLSIDAPGQMIASIMAKKGAVNPDHVLLDIPIGKEAKIKQRKSALKLRRKFEKVGKKLGIKMHVIITDGSQPIGNGIGVAPEARDVLWVLENDPRAPKDLREKSVMLCAAMIKNVKKVSIIKARKMVEKVLCSGRAMEKFFEMVRAQGGKETHSSRIKLGKYSYDFFSKSKGRISHINNKYISKIAKLTGSPKDIGAGLYLHKHVGDRVNKGERIITIYADSKEKCDYAAKVYREIDGISIK